MKKLVALMLLSLLAFTACEGSLPESASEAMPAMEEAVSEGVNAIAEQVEGETHTAVHWSYEGEGAPENWVALGYNECAGETQSPIDLASSAPADLQNIRFEYGDTAVKILNNGHTIQVDQIEGSQIVIGEDTYLLKQFHFHSPSEHTLNGEHFPLEMHLVHKTADDSKAAVVGIFIREGAENEAFAPVWADLPAEESEHELDAEGNTVYMARDTGATVSLAALLPAEQLIYRYNGSLTTPPCTPNVLWSMMQNPIEMSGEQIAAFTRIMSGNNRPVQALNERTLQLDETP